MANELTFHSAANSGDTLYAQVENMVGQVWNGSAFEAPVHGNWATYDIAMSEQATSTGIFRAAMPAAAAGAYSFVVRLQAGGSPAVGDVVLGSSAVFSWSGSVVTELDTAIAELGVAAPSATPSVRAGLMLLCMALHGKLVVQTSGTDAIEFHDSAGTLIWKKLISDDGDDYTEAKGVSG